MTARTANPWLLLPGAFALVGAAVLDLRGNQLSGAAVDAGTGLAWYVAGAVVYLARPGNRSAGLLLATSTLLAIGKAAGASVSLAATAHPDIAHTWAWVVLLEACGWSVLSAGIALFASFPDGKYQRPYERWIVRLLPAAFVPLALLEMIGSRVIGTGQFGWVTLGANSPIYAPGLDQVGAAAGALLGATLIGIVPALGLLVLRFRRFGEDQRRQIKWPLYAFAVSALGIAVLTFVPEQATPFWLSAVLYLGVQGALPAGLALGIVMYRGLDIEDVIRRSVVYGALWACIALAYVLAAASFGIALGQRVPLALAVLLAIVATLFFQPARRRLEALADRLVFGTRLTGYELISQLGVRLQATGAAEDVAGTVATAVCSGLGATWVRVLLNRPDPILVAATGVAIGQTGPAQLSAPLMQGQHVIGIIECGPKIEGTYQTKDQELLNTLGRQAALAIHNSQLSAELSQRLDELAASRARLVQAEDVERRRLERNLHDGIQQELVGLLARLGLARNQLTRDQTMAEATLRAAQVDARRALESLQDVARGIHPAVLTDRGLLEALAERATRMPIPVLVHANGITPDTRYPPDLEGAAYFFVSEALTNVLKYAGADNVNVRLNREPGQLVVAVQDDGCGFDLAAVRLSGLRGLKDRIEALGGHVDVGSRPGRGTDVRAWLPVKESAHA